MVQQSLSNEDLLKLGRISYQKLRDICDSLSMSGLWEEPQKILKRTIYEMLDTYLQAVLVQISLRANGFGKIESQYVLEVLETNPYGIEAGRMVEKSVNDAMNRVINSPPIILQLCGVSDQMNQTKLSASAFDCFINVILGIIYLNSGKNHVSLKAAEEYYKQIAVFLNQKDANTILGQRYWFKKISADRLDSGFYEEMESLKEFHNVKQKQKERIETMKQEMKEEKEQKLKKKVEQKERSEEGKQLEEYLDELNSLIGLKEVKQEVTSLINLIKVKKMREQYHMAVSEMTYHMVFTGNPGTGKTTVARLIAKIYKELGILSKGHLVETDRSGLVAGYVGQTALKVKEVVDRAIGGILFIDEAYALTNQTGNNDFGQEVVDTLVKLMEDNRNDFVVIVAGYQEEMKHFLDANPGLISRFNKFICFEDYSSTELMDILDYMSEKYGMLVTKEARMGLLNQLNHLEIEKRSAFGNARGIRNVFEKILINQANRLVKLKEPTREELQEILLEDVRDVIR